MANPLQVGQPTPEPPDIGGMQGENQGTPQGNLLMQGGAGQAGPAPVQGQPQQQPQQPAPTHAQTVAAMRHFSEINNEFMPLLQSPELGKADMKSGIIDAVTKLVAGRIVPPGAAVQQLAGVPSNPREQKQWLAQLFQQNQQAAAVILEQHRRAFAGQPDNPNDIYNADNHGDHINGVMSHYKKGA